MGGNVEEDELGCWRNFQTKQMNQFVHGCAEDLVATVEQPALLSASRIDICQDVVGCAYHPIEMKTVT